MIWVLNKTVDIVKYTKTLNVLRHLKLNETLEKFIKPKAIIKSIFETKKKTF